MIFFGHKVLKLNNYESKKIKNKVDLSKKLYFRLRNV